jgi:hypothetical protein
MIDSNGDGARRRSWWVDVVSCVKYVSCERNFPSTSMLVPADSTLRGYGSRRRASQMRWRRPRLAA